MPQFTILVELQMVEPQLFFLGGGDPNTDAQLVGEKAKVSFVLFLKIEKHCPDFAKKGLWFLKKMPYLCAFMS